MSKKNKSTNEVNNNQVNNKMSEQKEKEIRSILEEFDKELATSISADIKTFLEGSALHIKGQILKEPTIQINLSDDYTKLTAILRETQDVNLEKTYFEIDLLSEKYPKNSKTRKTLEKIQKKIKKVAKN